MLRRESLQRRLQRSRLIMRRLHRAYPRAQMMLKYSNHWELLVAVMLSAQCTDVMVNKVTGRLFKKYRLLSDYVAADPREFEKDIHSTGFYRNKTKHILAAARMVQERFRGRVPSTMEELLQIPGVARKTANVVLGNAFGIAVGIAVDTHVGRLVQRMGMSTQKNPERIEKDLMRLLPQNEWFHATYLLIDHGRAVCKAQRPQCDRCPLNDVCPSAFRFPQFPQFRGVRRAERLRRTTS